MTNEQIIFNSRLELLEQGLIGTTGNTIVFEDSEGKKVEVLEPEQLHTFKEWERLGYRVIRGQHAVVKLNIWKHVVRKADKVDEADRETMFMKLSSFFSQSQVEPLSVSEV